MLQLITSFFFSFFFLAPVLGLWLCERGKSEWDIYCPGGVNVWRITLKLSAAETCFNLYRNLSKSHCSEP